MELGFIKLFLHHLTNSTIVFSFYVYIKFFLHWVFLFSYYLKMLLLILTYLTIIIVIICIIIVYNHSATIE